MTWIRYAKSLKTMQQSISEPVWKKTMKVKDWDWYSTTHPKKQIHMYTAWSRMISESPITASPDQTITSWSAKTMK